MPDIPGGRRMCLGRTDLPLSTVGRLQATLAGAALNDAGLTALYCSTLSRSRQTAEYIGSPVLTLEGLEEMDAGDWDGLYFDEIMRRWPALYELRGQDPSASPPHSESREHGLERFAAAVRRALSASEGAIAIVAHASVSQTFLCSVMALPLDRARTIALPYGSVTRLTYENGAFAVSQAGVSPRPDPDTALCKKLLAALDTPPAIAAHGEAVAQEALKITRALNAAGLRLDTDLILPAALLHDIARREKNHAAVGADWLQALGYTRISEIVRQHHDPHDPSQIDETAVVFIADKLVRGTTPTGLAARFDASREKCVTPEALGAHERRYNAARTAAEKINEICGKDLIK